MQQVNALMAVCDNPLHGIASELSTKACETVRSCVGGALTVIKEVVEVASDVRTQLSFVFLFLFLFLLVALVLISGGAATAMKEVVVVASDVGVVLISCSSCW